MLHIRVGDIVLAARGGKWIEVEVIELNMDGDPNAVLVDRGDRDGNLYQRNDLRFLCGREDSRLWSFLRELLPNVSSMKLSQFLHDREAPLVLTRDDINERAATRPHFHIGVGVIGRGEEWGVDELRINQ